MLVNHQIRPYSATVCNEGTQTIFRCFEVRRQGKIWIKEAPYNVVVKNLNFPLEKKNPEAYKIVVKQVQGITISKNEPHVTIWASDIKVLDKNGTVIIESSKKAAAYLGKSKEELKAVQPEEPEVVQEDGELFDAF